MTEDPNKTGEIPSGVLKPRTGRQRRARRPHNWFFLVLGWLSLVPVIVVLVLRWRDVGHPLTIAVVAMTPVAAVPLLGGVLSSLFSRSNTLRTVTAVTVAGFLFTVSPADAVIGCGAETAADQMTIYTHNVLVNGGSPDGIAASILSENADVVVLQEVRWPFLNAMREDPRLARYEYHSDIWPFSPVGNIIWSRWPIVDLTVEEFVSSVLVRARIEGPEGEFTITNVHTLAPAQVGNVAEWRDQFAQLSRLDTSGPEVLAGDFNATADHRPMRSLLDSGWTDVHDPKGCGFDATWPVGRDAPIPLMRLDHVLVTDHYQVLDVRFGDPAGSDHLPLVTSIRLKDR